MLFCPFYHPTLTAQKMKSSKKWKKCLKISSFYTSVPKIMTICCAAPEIWCVIDVIIFHFRLFFAVYPHNSPKNEHFKKIKKCLKISSLYTIVPKIMTICYAVPEIWCVTDVIIFHFRLFFAVLPLKQPPKWNLTKNHYYMLYYSWDMAHDRCNCYFS